MICIALYATIVFRLCVLKIEGERVLWCHQVGMTLSLIAERLNDPDRRDILRDMMNKRFITDTKVNSQELQSFNEAMLEERKR